MNFNSILFPAPIENNKSNILFYKEEIIFIPRSTKKNNYSNMNIYVNDNSNKADYIPCLYMKTKEEKNTGKYLLYFHGNAEDIFNSTQNLEILKLTIPYNIISVEYPGYSIYYSEKSAKTIEEDSLIVFDYLVNVLNINNKDIVVMGRSIGSGPSVYIAANRNPSAIVLVSPFKSIKEIAETILGIFKFIIADRFRNIDIIDKVTCPMLLIHGQKDELVSYEHSVALSKKTNGPYELILPDEMDHNNFDIYEDFADPITCFFKRHNLLSESKYEIIDIPENLFKFPDYLVNLNKKKEIIQKDSVSKLVRNFMDC